MNYTIANAIHKGVTLQKIYCLRRKLTLLILMAQGAPGKPGRQVLKAETSEKVPRPQALMPDTRNL